MISSSPPTPSQHHASRRSSTLPWGASADSYVPEYRGEGDVGGRLPTRAEPWLKGASELLISPGFYLDEASRDAVQRYAESRPWVWPERRHILLSDVHADADAFVRSLVASGGVSKSGPGTREFELTEIGRGAIFVIAGDCFDKGPSNLELLRALKHLIDLDADVVLLAGNHDIRALVGMTCIGASDVRLAHLFVRMGKKAVPLFKELYDGYLAGDGEEPSSPADEQRIHERLFPSSEWFREFPRSVRGLIPDKKVEHELVRIREKCMDLESHCARAGLSLANVERAAEKFIELFVRPGGEFAWFFERMQLAYRAGSLLFVHAGADDVVAARLRRDGVEGINRWFREMLDRRELFDLYHGPIGNVFRTKYRDTEPRLSVLGVQDLKRAGIYAIVHGHRNILHGQRIVFREGMLNFECDASIDRNTRVIEGLAGPGGAATVFREDGCVLGVSTDFPAVKVFDVARSANAFTYVGIGNDDEERRPVMAETETTEVSGTHLAAVEEEAEETKDDKRKAKLSFEAGMDVEEAVSYFEAIIAGMKKGTIQFRRGDEQLDLTPAPYVNVKVKAATKGSKEKIEFELSWSSDAGKPGDLEIS